MSPTKQAERWVTIPDFKPGIYSRITAAASSTPSNYAPSPPGAAQASGTFRCAALPSGALAPLPARQALTSPALALGVDSMLPACMTVRKPIGPSNQLNQPNPVPGSIEDIHILFEYRRQIGPVRYGWSWVDLVLGGWNIIKTVNPISGSFGGQAQCAGFTQTRMQHTAPYLSPGTPVVICGLIASLYEFGFLSAFPDPAAPTVIGTKDFSTDPTPATTPIGSPVAHQGRLLAFCPQRFPAATGYTTTNEEINYTDPPNSDVYGSQNTVFWPENSTGYGAMDSVSSGELFLVKHDHGALLISGDINNPTVVYLPNVTPTGGFLSTGCVSPIGFVYATSAGIYTWNSGDRSIRISDALDDVFWPFSQTGVPLSMESWGDKIIIGGNWLYDIINESWWYLEDPTAWVGTTWGVGWGQQLYSAGGPGGIFPYNVANSMMYFSRQVAATSYQWTGQPLWETNNEFVDILEVVCWIQGVGSVQVEFLDQTGTVAGATPSTNINASYPQLTRFQVSTQSSGITPRIISTGTGGNPAPIIYPDFKIKYVPVAPAVAA